jgi:hypothetical protein
LIHVEDRLLVGRDRELTVLGGVISAALGGERAVLMLTGEPGIGKTRMLEELVTRIVAAGGIATWARTWEVGLTPPFFPWIQLLGALETPDDRAPALGSLEAHGDATVRLSRFAEVAAFLGRRASHAPVALLFDDLHASDASSLQLLEYAMPLLVGRKVLFALAARDTDASRETATALGRLQRGAYRLPLARLGRDAVQTLVGDRADARRVFELSDGNPLFVEELLAAARTGALGLPRLSSVRAVIRDRVLGLPEDTRGALLAAAVVGRDFRGQIVSDMVKKNGMGRLLEPAVALEMLAVTSPDHFRFSHALVAEALADELGVDERAHLHLSAARAMAHHAPQDTSAIAHHLLAAGEPAARDAVSAAERAAAECMGQLAFEDAASFLGRAVTALGLVVPEDLRKRAALLTARAEALQHATQHAAAAVLCDEAAAIVRSLAPAPTSPGTRDAELFARIALARGLEFRFGRTDPLLVAVLGEALGLLGEEGPLPLRARLLARLAAAEQPAVDPREPIARALSAIELAKQLTPRDQLDVTYVATAALVDYVEPKVLEGIHEDVLRLARGVDRWISVHTRLRLCFTALERTDRQAFDAAMQSFIGEAETLALPRWTRQIHMLRALVALLDGRFADAEDETSRFEAISAEIGDAGAPWIADVHRAMAAWVRTAPPDPALRARLGEYAPGRAAIAAWFACQAGSLEDARTALAEIGDRLPFDPDMACMVASAVAFAGDRALANETYEALYPRAGRIVLASMVGFAVMDLVDRLLLGLAVTAERWDAVDTHARTALAVAGKLGSPVWTARVRVDWADALDRRGRPGDGAQAQSHRSSALPVAERLGMPGLSARCTMPHRQNERNESGSAPTPPVRSERPAPPPSSRVAFEQHGELWVVSGLGEQVHVKDSRGMQMLARLIAEPGSPLHVLDLGGSGEPVDGGDSGTVLDGRARAEYRARLAELYAERDEAESFSDRGRFERASAEIEALGAELERAFGLGGRERRAGAASERARTNVQRRVTHALAQIGAASPRLGEHLTATIRTGTYCVYEAGP